MKKILTIDGMHCEHCQNKVQKALNAIPGVSAKVDLKKKQATLELSQDVLDNAFEEALKEAGFTLVAVKEKKGLFGN